MGGKNAANNFVKKYRLNAVRSLLLEPLVKGTQNTSAERAWKILKVKNRNGYMNTRQWANAVKNMNKYNLTENQKNVVRLANALVKAGKPPGGGNRRRLHPDTFRRFKNEGLRNIELVNQIKRNIQSEGGYKGRMIIKAGGAAALGVVAAPHVKILASKYGPGVVEFLRKRANMAKNGVITNTEIQNLATNWKKRGFEIRNMNSFARYVRAGGNASNPNRAGEAFNKAFRNGVVSMVGGGVASSVGAAALAGGGAATAARGGGITFGQGVQSLRRITNNTRSRMMRNKMLKK